jgi:hypothetical protein
MYFVVVFRLLNSPRLSDAIRVLMMPLLLLLLLAPALQGPKTAKPASSFSTAYNGLRRLG